MMSAMAAPDMRPLDRLADLVKQRRLLLGMHIQDVAQAAGITPKTYSRIETGDPTREITYSKVEPVLGWAHGSCRDILAGRGPTVVESAVEPGGVISPVTGDDLEADVEQAVQNAAIGLEGTDLSASEIRKLKEQVIQELRLRGRLR